MINVHHTTFNISSSNMLPISAIFKWHPDNTFGKDPQCDWVLKGQVAIYFQLSSTILELNGSLVALGMIFMLKFTSLLDKEMTFMLSPECYNFSRTISNAKLC